MFYFIPIGQQAKKVYGPFESYEQLLTLAIQNGYSETQVFLIEGTVRQFTIRKDFELKK